VPALEIERLGLVRLSAIGDVVHAMPLAMGLRRAFPGARITWIVQEEAGPLLSGHPAVDDVLIFPRHGWVGGIGRFVGELRQRRLDAIVDPQGNTKSGFVARASGAPVRAGLHRRDCKEWLNVLCSNRRGPRSASPHGIDRAWAAAAPLGVEPGPDRYGLEATPAELEAWTKRCASVGADPDGPLLAINLTDPEDARSWFSDRWAALVRRAAADGWQVVLNGPAERRGLSVRIIDAAAVPGVFDLTGRDDLRGLLAQLQAMAGRGGNVLVSGDSGPLHVAVAVGLPVVCLSGPQDPERTGPRAGGIVVQAWEGLACAPCVERTCQLSPPDRPCMRNITVEAVTGAVGRIRAARSD
jgi:ADP-heptose:LPS heptosyltransferase